MTKQELIKQEWKCISNVKYDKNNGWAISYCVNGTDDFDEDILDKIEFEYLEDDLIKWRPKSLKGICDNNGWVKIESEEDLPKESGLFWIVEDGHVINEPCNYHKSTRRWVIKCEQYPTHYQPITKPLEPLH
jgi:hypothetical protein